MGDLIDRQAAIDAIVSITIFETRDAIKEILENRSADSWVRGVNDAIDEIEHVTAVDAVPVVRCKDCKWGIEKTNCRGEDMIECYNTESPVCDSCMLTSPEWFCAEGEKKNDSDAD